MNIHKELPLSFPGCPPSPDPSPPFTQISRHYHYANGIVAGLSSRGRLHGVRVSPPIAAESRVCYNETLESVNMIVPGLIAVIMSIIAAMLTALTIAREWERGMEQLAATPVGCTEVILGKLLPYVAIGLFDVTLAVAAGILIFDVPLRGNVLLLPGSTLLFLIGALSFGIFISATLQSQVLATQAAMLSTYLPALLLSGFMFSIASMPMVLRAVTFAVPARYLHRHHTWDLPQERGPRGALDPRALIGHIRMLGSVARNL